VIPVVPDHVPEGLADGLWVSSGPDEPPAGMPDLWPEDVLSEGEWEAGWFDRQVAQGRLEPGSRGDYPRCFGGTAEAS
jgi:hypothetical protein